MKLVKEDGYNAIFNNPDYGVTSNPVMMSFENCALAGIDGFYVEDDLARRIVDVVPEEMVAPGFKISGLDDDPEFASTWSGLGMDQHITDALCWSRLHGKSAIMLMLDDRKLLSSQATEGAKVESVRVYSKDEFSVDRYETNQRSPRYGMPLLYKVKPASGNAREFRVHFSRMKEIDGGRLPNASQNTGGEKTGASVLSKSVVEAILDYNRCHRLATELLNRKQQIVWGVKGLALLCDDDDGLNAARVRMAQVGSSSGVGRPVGVDAEAETYTVLNSDISGVPEFLSMKMDRLVELTGIHEIILRGKNPGGVSASPNTALQTFYKMIDRKRKDDLQPILEFILPFVIDDKEWNIKFNPLTVLSEAEKADILDKVATASDKLIANQSMEIEEVRDTLEAMELGLVLKENPGKLPTREDIQAAKDQQEKSGVNQINTGDNNEGEEDS